MLPLQLGVRAHDIQASTKEELAHKMKKLGCQHMQFALKKSFPEAAPDINKITNGTANYFGNYFQSEGLKISILGCYVNMSSLDLEVRKRELANFKNQISLMHDFKASVIGTETGSVGKGFTTDNFTEDAYQIMRGSVMELIEVAEQFGVTMAIEAGQNHPLHTYQLTKRLIDEVQSPNLKIILDIMNLCNMENYQESEKLYYRAIETLQDHLCAFHLKDMVVENKQLKVVPVGKGIINHRPALEYIKQQSPLMYASLEATPEADMESAIEGLKEQYASI